jgi:TPR repeat protein
MIMRKRTMLCVLVVLNISHTAAQDVSSLPDYVVAQNARDFLDYRLAADQGNADAQVKLGFMYREGRGVTKDHSEALKWYRLAAQQGNWSAQSNLGSMYDKGQGVTQDYVRAHMWYSLAASTPSGEDREGATRDRDAVAIHLSPAQVARAQEMARQCETSGFKNCD